MGIRVSDLSLRGADDGRIESVAIAHFLTAGILVRDGRRWQIKDNQIDDIGCHTSQPCPRLPGKDADTHVKGRRTVGYGVMMTSVGASDAVIEGNRISSVTKIGIEAYSNLAKLGSMKRVRGIKILGNRVSGAVSAGITSNGGVSIDIVGNEVWDSGGPGLLGNGGAGISCGGPSEKILIADNVIHDTDGAGLRVGCQGDDVTIRGNRVAKACRRDLIEQAAIQIVGRKGRGRGIVVDGNVVDADLESCMYGMLFVNWEDVRIRGGNIQGGLRTAVYFGGSQGIRLSDIEASAAVADAPALWIRPDVSDMTIARDVRIARDAIKDIGASNLVFEGR